MDEQFAANHESNFTEDTDFEENGKIHPFTQKVSGISADSFSKISQNQGNQWLMSSMAFSFLGLSAGATGLRLGHFHSVQPIAG